MSGRANQVDQLAAMTSIVELAPHAAAARYAEAIAEATHSG